MGHLCFVIKLKKMKYLSLVFAGITLALVTMSFKPERIDGKKVKHLQIEKVLPFSAAKVWGVVGEDYGKIAHSHPKIIKSDYIGGALKGAEGAERACYFNEDGSRFLKEKIAKFDAENFTLVNTVYQAGRFPVDASRTVAIYKVTPIDENSCKLSFDMKFRTSPAWMGGMMKGSFKNLIGDYFIAIEHHIKTGEEVTQENFKEIKKLYN